MATPIQRLSRLASRTFSRLNTGEGLSNDMLLQLKSRFNEITADDVCFDARHIQERDRLTHEKAPVSYIHMWEDDCFSMGIFVVKRGGQLPLHDHPGMFGLLKVIYGTLKIVSFSEVSGVDVPEEISQLFPRRQRPLLKPVKLQQDGLITSYDMCCQLTPSEGNFHEISSESDMAAFVDILAPPYNHSRDRDCNYYKLVPTDDKEPNRHIEWLVRVSQPTEFWCDTVDYQGPDLEIENN
ncbi:hypothetical protein C0Q70_10249 [Pomacea canaliculata]|uniref:2-aminoethanethiol dioxygenase n=2 Tax=Pomacea canaliculata TaxID=400727 RepID=A0A2T7PC23_POMCA|nr:hypothetical protein C0Q70_10249 [Pomacea canaliculata]